MRTARMTKSLPLPSVVEGPGVSRAALVLRELGRAFPLIENLLSLGDLSSVSIDWLLGRDPAIKLPNSGTERLFSNVIWDELLLEESEFLDEMIQTFASKRRRVHSGD